MMRNIRVIAFTVAVFVAGLALGHLFDADSTVSAQGHQVFELRTYTTNEGKLPSLLARFNDHTMKIFENHGMTNIGYFVPQDAPLLDNTLIYVLAHDSRDAAMKSWSDFGDDPEWARVASVDTELVAHVERVFMEATDFSPMK
jgi:hypothetical protein